MNILCLISWIKGLTRGAALQPVVAMAGRTAPTGDERALGCGWFDSSHELRRGLLVHEHATPDTLATELPLINWLELQLSGWRVTSPT